MNAPTIQHWLVPALRHAGVAGCEDLRVPADTDAPEAWSLVGMATGLDEARIAEIVTEHLGLDRARMPRGATPFATLLPGSLAHRSGLLPLAVTDTLVTVATADPVALDAERDVARYTARTVKVAVATPSEMASALDASYPEGPHEPVHDVGILTAEDLPPLILVVEDDGVTRLLVRTLLQERGFRVLEAATGEQALERLESEEAVHLVTLDLDLGGEASGLDVLRTMRDRVRTKEIPVVVATGIDQPGVEMELFEAGADDFIVKPLDPPRFLLRVLAVLRRYGLNPPAGAE